ncbi:hypothetical protein AAVH_26113 [Aphelenchoides avenae]|nr:hypothetical protein AAVH_26113 [Aphelenchus avenae]
MTSIFKALVVWIFVFTFSINAHNSKHASKIISFSSTKATTSTAKGNGTTSSSSSSTTASTTPHTTGSSTIAGNATTTRRTTTTTTTNEIFKQEYRNESTIMRRLNQHGNAEVQAQCGKHVFNENSLGMEWSAVLVDNEYQEFICVATMITFRHLLTSGECFRQLEEGRAGRTSGASLYHVLSCDVIFVDNTTRCDTETYPKNYTLLDVEMAFYVWNKDEEWSHDIAIIQLKHDIDPVRTSARPACLRSNDASTQYATFTASANFGRNGSFNDVCHSAGMRCAHQEIDDKVDAELHIGTGVFGAYDVPGPSGNIKTMYFLYGFIIEKVRDESLIVVREVKSLLFDLCFYTGVCVGELEASRNDESKLKIFLDMAYIPELHDGRTLSTATDDYSLLNNQTVKRIPYPSIVTNNNDDIELYHANHVDGVLSDQPSGDADSDGHVGI